jgi:hypothetical protein
VSDKVITTLTYEDLLHASELLNRPDPEEYFLKFNGWTYRGASPDACSMEAMRDMLREHPEWLTPKPRRRMIRRCGKSPVEVRSE